MAPMKHEHTPRRLERIVDRGWDYTFRYMVLYLAVSEKTRVLSTCIGAVTIVVGAVIGYRL